MTVSIAIVMSLDGKLTRHNEQGISDWASKEDQKHFSSLIAANEVIIMGSMTYKAAKPSLRLHLPIKRIVLTRSPKQFETEAVEGKLEFRNIVPSKLIQELKEQGIKKVLVVGGPEIMSELLDKNAVHYIYATIEPRVFGTGIPFLQDTQLNTKLQLISSKQLNEQGTLLITYRIQA